MLIPEDITIKIGIANCNYTNTHRSFLLVYLSNNLGMDNIGLSYR